MNIVTLNHLDYDELLSVSQQKFNDKNRPEVSNKFRKALFFILREGLYKTYRKVTSKKDDQISDSKNYTLLKLKKGAQLYANLSIQSTEVTDDFVISNSFFKTDIHSKLEDFLSDKKAFNQFEHQPQETNFTFLLRPTKKENLQEIETGVFLYGLGDYSRVYISPQIKDLHKVCCVDYNAGFSKLYADKFNFDAYKLVPQDSYGLLRCTRIPLAIIATYHSDHSRLAEEIFKVNNNALIFIEKPPCVTLKDLDILLDLYKKNAKIEIGYNRRYIKINQKVRDLFRNKIKVINISVKEIKIRENHWYFWDNQGTRITGNLTHWIDLATFWIDEKPIEMTMLPSIVEDETIGLSILYDGGSLVNISVSDKGNSLRGVQETIEIRTGEETLLINDYTSVKHVHKSGKSTKTRSLKRKKGHEEMYKQLIRTYRLNTSTKYPRKDLIYTTIITFFAAKMFKENIRHLELSDILNTYLN